MKVFIIAATTIDGFIGKTADHLADWTTPEDKRLFVRLTKQAGVMIMGSRTFNTIGRALPGRRTIVMTKRPEAITAEGVETTADSPAEIVTRLRRESAAGVAICGGASVYTQFLQAGVVDELYIHVQSVAFGAGVSLFNAPLEARLTLLESSELPGGTVLLHYAVVSANSSAT